MTKLWKALALAMGVTAVPALALQTIEVASAPPFPVIGETYWLLAARPAVFQPLVAPRDSGALLLAVAPASAASPSLPALRLDTRAPTASPSPLPRADTSPGAVGWGTQLLAGLVTLVLVARRRLTLR